MEGGQGMVAVVHGLRDSGLAVTLLDGSKQYTLMPNAKENAVDFDITSPSELTLVMPPTASQSPVQSRKRATREVASQQTNTFESGEPTRCDSAAQATDGRYASTYKTAHCKISPTSPPAQLTEFPPQRVELCPGKGNFEVGGYGSGESYTPIRSSGSFRGRSSWPDRGSVCSPKPSRDSDAFANSLRKYPNLAVERSTEMVERLINYSQAKNLSRTYQNRYTSSFRNGIECDVSNRSISDRSTYRYMQKNSIYQKNYESDNNIFCKPRRLEESPTRDIKPRLFEPSSMDINRLEVKNFEKTKDSFETVSSYPYHQPVCPLRERYEIQPSGQKTPYTLPVKKSMNMEVQAATEMVSKLVATVPRIKLLKKTVAVPLSPAISRDTQKHEVGVSHHTAPRKPNFTYKSVQTAIKRQDFSAQTSSSTQIEYSIENYLNFITKTRSKSEEKNVTNMALEDEILELLERVSVCPNADPAAHDNRRRILKRISTKIQKLSNNYLDDEEKTKVAIDEMLKYVPVWVPFGDIQVYRDAIAEKIMYKMKNFRTVDNVYRAEASQFCTEDESSVEKIITDWIKTLPIKTCNSFEMSTIMNHIVQLYTNRLKNLIINKRSCEEETIRRDLLNDIFKIPMNVKDCHKMDYLKQVIVSLLRKIKQISEQKLNRNLYRENKQFNGLDIYVQPTENELREAVRSELNIFFHKADMKSDIERKKYLEIELIDILIESMQAISQSRDKEIEDEIVILFQELSNVTENEARCFAARLFLRLRDYFTVKDVSNTCCLPVRAPSRNYIILQNTGKTENRQRRSVDKNTQYLNDSISPITKQDIDSNLAIYKYQLIQQIEDWLDNSQIKMTHAHDKRFRQIIINDLAGDIIDRIKYVELNETSRRSNDHELEHLRYQIFKWINKLAGEENKETLDCAPTLMQKIQSIPVPMLTIPHQYIENAIRNQSTNGLQIENKKRNSIQNRENNSSNLMIGNSSHNSANIQASATSFHSRNENPSSSCCINIQANQFSPSIKQLNDEYDNFLKKWVQEIPIQSSTPEERSLADKARQGIYNGIWKIVTKLKFDPVALHNPFYYEDALENELDELLNCLPETRELNANKHQLKIKLIQKTTSINHTIREKIAPASFKQRLVENVSHNLPPRHVSADKNEMNDQAIEDIQIQKLVDDYVLCAKYKEANKSKADVYRKKIIRETHSIVENIKKAHEKELKDIDTDLYVNNVLNALHKVPLPSEEVLSEEAREIQISNEIEQWFMDIPALQNVNPVEANNLKNNLLKRIINLEKVINIYDCSGQKALKKEISLFISKIPVELVKNADADFMAEELTNRLKNKAKEMQADDSAKRKSVAFLDSVGYYEFSMQMPGCSSFTEMPDCPALVNQSSYMVRDGEKVTTPPKGFVKLRTSYEMPQSNEYFTIEDSQAHKKPITPQPEISYHTIPDSQNTIKNVPAGAAGNNQLQMQPYPSCPNNDCKTSDTGVTVSQSIMNRIPMPRISGESQAIPLEHSTHINSKIRPQPLFGLKTDQDNTRTCQPAHHQRQINSSVSQNEIQQAYIPSNNDAANISGAPIHRSLPPQEPLGIDPQNCCPSVSTQAYPQGITNNSHRIPEQKTPIDESYYAAERAKNLPRENIGGSHRCPNVSTQAYPQGITNNSQRISKHKTPFDEYNYAAEQAKNLPRENIGGSYRCPNVSTQAYPQGITNNSQRISEQKTPIDESYYAAEQAKNLPRGIISGNMNPPGNTTTFGQPEEFSTPQQYVTEGYPPKPIKKRSSKPQKIQNNLARRRLDLTDSDDLSESDEDGPCFCMNRKMLYRRRLHFFDFDIEDPECYPYPYSCPYFY